MTNNNILLYEIPNNNHGCSGFQIEIIPINEKIGKVIAGHSCGSCWQVGHSTSESPIPIGSIVSLPKNFGWKRASQIDKTFHQIDDSIAERTKISPFQVDIFLPSRD